MHPPKILEDPLEFPEQKEPNPEFEEVVAPEGGENEDGQNEEEEEND